MFWRFGGYANISTIDSILDKPDVTLEEVLDESDLIQELKQHNTKLIEFLRDDAILQRLLDYVVAPPAPALEDDDEDAEEEEEETPKKSSFSPVRGLNLGRSRETKTKRQEEREERDREEKTRQKYAYVACEVLSSETWSIIEALMDNQAQLRKFWELMRKEPPLDASTAGYFTKINETLLDKKTEETLDFVKSLEGIIPAMLQHVDCPMVMDLLLKIISMEKAEAGQGIVDWLQSQNLMPLLLAFLGPEYPTFTQTSAGDFIKAIITISANASQNEQSCIGPNSLTRQLVSETCIEALIANMLRGGNPLTVGVGIIIEVIRKNNSDYDPEIQAGQELPPSSSDPIYLGTLLRLFAKHVPDFTELILSPNHTVPDGDGTKTVKRKELQVAFGKSIEPLGFDRFKTCELMAELLHCSNMGLLNERGSEAYVQQRDKEREKLKAQGALARVREPQSAATEFSEDESSFNVDSSSLGAKANSPGESRRLEVMNSADEDGFEDVGTSGDLSDEIKEDPDEKDSFELESNVASSASPIKPSQSRVSLDDEFFDEPLSSPGPKPDEDKKEDPTTSEDPKLGPASPATALSSEVKGLDLDKDSEMTNTPDSDSAEDSTTDDLVAEITQHLSPGKSQSEAPPLPVRNQGLSVGSDVEGANPTRDLSPHPDDKPAPLFSSKTDVEPQKSTGSDVQGQANQQSSQDVNEPQPMDTQDGQQAFVVPIENDIDGRPIVGDYLKVMFVEHQVVPTILDFFFRFPWNNFLHNVVYDVVQQVFNGPMDRGFNRNLAIDLFQAGRITERIIEGQLRSDEAQARNNMRLGYMGHLTLIAEEVVKFSERHPPEILSQAVLDRMTNKIWTDYVENVLAETRERDNAILGGVRPDMAVGPRQAVLNAVNAASGYGNSGSSALANAGLNGGSGLDSMELTNNTNTSFLSGGSLLSGFGSSSDEEDEEMEEIIEHEEGNEGNTDQYPTYTPSSLTALSLFSPPLFDNKNDTSGSSSEEGAPTPSSAESNSSSPPHAIPPPLNIPPSRARRQLAARLALHNKGNNSPAAAGSLDALLADTSTASPSTTGADQDPKGPANDEDSSPWTSLDAADAEPDTGKNLTGGKSSDSRQKAAPIGNGANKGDWVDFEASDDDDSDEDGEDVPIRLTVSPSAVSPDDSSKQGGFAGKVNSLFTSASSDDDKDGSDDDAKGRPTVKEAKVRSAIEADD